MESLKKLRPRLLVILARNKVRPSEPRPARILYRQTSLIPWLYFHFQDLNFGDILSISEGSLSTHDHNVETIPFIHGPIMNNI
jgi:hypothetical protein